MNLRTCKELKNGYKINIWLVRILSLFIISFSVFALFQILTHERFFLENPSDTIVKNPFYNYDGNIKISADLMAMEYLPPHFTAGFDQPFYIADASIIGFFVLLAGIIFNHFKFNY